MVKPALFHNLNSLSWVLFPVLLFSCQLILSAPHALAKLTLEERSWLQAHSNIRIGIDPAWAPIEYLDPHNKTYQGIASEYVNYLEKTLSIKTRYNPDLNWKQVLEHIKIGEIDVLPAVSKTPEREKYLNFTRPYLRFPYVIFTRHDAALITSITELLDKKLVVERNYANHEILKAYFPEIQLVLVDNTEQALSVLSLGQADAYMGNLAATSHIILQTGTANIKVAAPTPFSSDLAFAVRKDWPELVNIIQQALDTITPRQKNTFKKKWFAIRYEHAIDYTLLWQVIAITLCVLLLFSLWIWQIRKQKEALKISEERFQLAMNASNEGLWDWNLITDEGYVSPGYPKMLGYQQNELESNPLTWENLLHPDDKKQAVMTSRDAITNCSAQYAHEFRLRHKDGHYIHINSIGSIVSTDKNGKATRAIGTHQNITQRKQAEIELAKAKLAAEQASQFKSDFLSNMSHEIRTPMNAIIGLGYLLLQTDLHPQQRDYMQKIQNASKSLLTIINDILDFSKIEAGKLHLESVNFKLDPLFENLRNLFYLENTNKNIELIFDIHPKIPTTLIGDSIRLTQVLTNLVSNAFKFTEQGEIKISVHPVKISEHKAILKFSVTDSGCGIPKHQYSKIFDSFSQTDTSTTRLYGGTGLGLTICKKLVSMMHGDIDVISELGQGSTFFFSAEFALDPQNSSPHQLLEADLRGRHILVVDANVTASNVLRDQLASLSYKVTIVNSAKQAYKTLANSAKHYDLILMDWFMPQTNGLDAIKYIKKTLHKSNIPSIIMVSAYAQEEIAQQANNMGVDGLLLKPVTPAALFESIVKALKPSAILSTPVNSSENESLSGTVLLVEDNSINRQVAEVLLKSFGLEVEIAINGQDALNKLKQQAPEKTLVDIILMDIQMPVMDGIQATQEIRKYLQFKTLPIIAMTAHAMAGDKQKSLDAGMNEHITKPIDPEELYNTLSHWLTNNTGKKLTHSVSKTPIPLPDYSEHLDVEWGLKRVGGNQQLFSKLLREFLQDHQQDISILEFALTKQKLQDAKRIIHTINGVAGNIGAHKLQQSCILLEQQLENKISFQTSFTTFKQDFTHLMLHLNQFN